MLQEKLPECTNKQRCDEFCTSFCYLNSKGARKKLVQALIKLPRSRLDLTPTYARWVSIGLSCYITLCTSMQSVCTFIGCWIFHSYDLHFFPLLLVIRSILFFLLPVFHLFNFIFTDTFSFLLLQLQLQLF